MSTEGLLPCLGGAGGLAVAIATQSSKELGGEGVPMEIDGGRKKILEGEEEVTTEGLLASCGVDVPKPRLSRPGRQRNTASSLPPGSLLCSGWARLSGGGESILARPFSANLAGVGEDSDLSDCLSEAFVKREGEESFQGRAGVGTATLRPVAVVNPN